MCPCNRNQLRQQQCLQNEDTCLERVLNCLPGENELKQRCIQDVLESSCDEVEDEEIEDGIGSSRTCQNALNTCMLLYIQIHLHL